jgi:hypothetical protein
MMKNNLSERSILAQKSFALAVKEVLFI